MEIKFVLFFCLFILDKEWCCIYIKEEPKPFKGKIWFVFSKTLFSIFVPFYALYCRYYRYHKPYQQNSWLSYRHPAMMAKQLLVHWPIHIRTWLCVSPTCQEKFYNIWVISRVLIGWELWSIRAQTTEITWWWCNLFFTSLHTQLSKNLEPEMDIKNRQKRTA